MHKAYDQYVSSVSPPEDFQSWRHRMELEYPQFRYWSISLKMELNLLVFLKSVRSGNFSLYKNALKSLLPWFFALDHYNYARWLSIHWYDMATVDKTNIQVKTAFEEGCFVITRTKSPFFQWESTNVMNN